MKKMYLEVEVEKDCEDLINVFYRTNRYFHCTKDDVKLVEIEDAENKGAEKLYEAINNICFSDSVDVARVFDGYCTLSNIIDNFSPKEIIQRVEKIKAHVPTTGDVYKASISGGKVVVISYDKEKKNVQLMSDTCFMLITLNTLNEFYSFTGRNYNEFSSILNELKGDNT